MDVKRLFLLLLAIKISTATGYDIHEIYAACGENGSYPNIEFFLQDTAVPFSQGLCKDSTPYFAVIRDEFDACAAKQVVNEVVSSEVPPYYESPPIWIRFDIGLNTSNLTSGSLFLGNRMNFTLEKSNEVCIALQTKQLGVNLTTVGTWITVDCSTKAKTLCAVNATNIGQNLTYQNSTNSDIFSAQLFRSISTTGRVATTEGTTSTLVTWPHSASTAWPTTLPNFQIVTDTSAVTTNYFVSAPTSPVTQTGDGCDFSRKSDEDIVELEERWKQYAMREDRDCVVGDGEERFLAVLQNSSTCDDDKLKFTAFNATCLNITTYGKYAVAEIPVKPDQVNKYMGKTVTDYNQNKRTTKLLTKSNVFFSYSVFHGSNASTAGHISFHARLFSKATLSANASYLTFDNDRSEGLLSTTRRVLGYRPECVFIDGSGRFDTYGCECTKQDGDIAKCVSNHTTVFAVLLSVESVAVPSTVKVLSVVTETISLFFLAVTFFILVRVRKKVRGERIAVQINLVVSLFFLHFSALLGDVALHYPAFCRAVAVLTHYFLLASALWMTNEAILLFLKTSRWAFLSAKRRKVVVATMIFAWGTAATLTFFTAVVGFFKETYMSESFIYQQLKGTMNATSTLQYEYCWLSGNSGIRWAAIGPVIFLISVNLVISVKVTVFVFRKRQEMKNFKPTKQIQNKHKLDSHYLDYLSASLKAFIVLLPTLGLPWLLLLASNVHQQTTRLSFMYINVIVNGLQGVFVFVVYCVVGKAVRSATVKSLSSLGNTWHSFTEIPESRRKSSAGRNMEKYCTPKNTVRPYPINNMNSMTYQTRKDSTL